MDTNDLAGSEYDQRRQQLTDDIRKLAAGARDEKRHPARVRNVLACGRALAELRLLLKYGDWDRWVAEQCGLSRSTANRYMRLASRTGCLKPLMGIREAYVAAGVIQPRQPAGPAKLGQ